MRIARLCIAFGRLSHKVTTLSKNISIAVSGNKPFGGSASKSAFPGTHFHKLSGKWCSMVTLADRNANGKHKRKQVPGLYATAAEAHAARVAFIAANGVAAPTEVRSRNAAPVTTAHGAA